MTTLERKYQNTTWQATCAVGKHVSPGDLVFVFHEDDDAHSLRVLNLTTNIPFAVLPETLDFTFIKLD